MSQLKVNSIVPVGGLPSGATGGGIIQVVQVTKTDMFSTTSDSYSDFMTATITPQSSSNKILCMFSAFEGMSGGDGNTYSRYKLMRGSTHIYKGDAGSNAGSATMGRFGRQSTFKADYIGCTFIDSPSTTSSTTYKIQVASPRAGTFKVFLGGSLRDTFFGESRVPSSFILMEVSV
tara:strand:+ start:53 stop:580 length:528 start_codon:yes stop_codon:yes gene_type:complete